MQAILGSLAVIFLFICLLQSATLAQETCAISQVTDTVGGESETGFLNQDGTLGAFSSDSDINGGNPDGSFEAYLVDLNTFLITQITDGTGTDSFIFDITEDEGTVALSSETDLTGGNPDGNREIVLYDRLSMTFTQITNSVDEDNIVPALNSDGSLIAIDSRADLTGGNPDLNREIFLFDADTSMITQLTDTQGGNNLSPSIDPGATTIAFHSSADVTGDNPDGSLEVFLFDTAAATFSQITNGMNLQSASPSLNSDASLIALNSDTDPTGGNPDNNREIFLFDTNTAQFTQVTDTTLAENVGQSISSDGTLIAFSSNADITGENADGNREIFLFNNNTAHTTQVTTSTVGSSSSPLISGNGTRILFRSSSNFTGDNPDGNFETFLANCFDGNIPGDANGDGVINILDVTAILNDILGLSPAPGNGDCNEDGQVDILDVTCVLNIILGL